MVVLATTGQNFSQATALPLNVTPGIGANLNRGVTPGIGIGIFWAFWRCWWEFTLLFVKPDLPNICVMQTP